MKLVCTLLLLSATAHADPVAYVEVGPVTAIDFGAAPARPIELGLRIEAGANITARFGLFAAFRDMGTIQVIPDMLHHPGLGGPEPFTFSSLSMGARIRQPIGAALGFAELYGARSHLGDTYDGCDFSQDQVGAGLRVGAIAHWDSEGGLELGAGAAISVEGYVPGQYSADRSVSLSLAADAFVTLGF